MKYNLLSLFLALSTFVVIAQEPFDMSTIPAPLFRCPIYDGAADSAIQWNSETNGWWIFYMQRRVNVLSLQDVSNCS